MSLPKIIQKILTNYGYGQALTGNDNDVVHKTGEEVIEGKKKFGETNFLLLDLAKGTTPTSKKWAGHYIVDSTATFGSWDVQKRFGWIDWEVASDGSSRATISSCKNEANSTDRCVICVGYDENGESYAYCPPTSSTRTFEYDILTRDWIPKDTRIVHTTGDETISGLKTFNEAYTNLKSPTIGRTVRPSTNNQDLSLIFLDKDNYVLGTCQYINRTTGGADIKLSCYDPTKTTIGGADFAGIYVGWDENNIPFSTAPETSSSRSSGYDVVTRNWIPKDTRIVHTTGDESVNGRKAFQVDTYIVNSSWKKGTAPGSNLWISLIFADDGSSSATLAKNMIAVVQGGLLTDGSSGLQLTAFKNAANSSSAISLQFLYLTNDKGYFRPTINNVVSLGATGYRWSEIWCSQSSINTSSDERLKQSVSSIPDDVLDAWDGINWIQFKYNDAVEEKGQSNARLHNGLIAQEVDRVFKSKNLDVSKYGLFLHDEWDAEPEEKDEEGNVIQKARSAGDEYGLRYTEALCMEAAYNRRRVSRLEERLLALEQELAELKNSAA